MPLFRPLYRTAIMESFLPLSGFQLPFQRRLSRLYNDTKKSTDFVKEPVQNEEDPEVKNLHRKLRIQKDRLVSWGLEWSDPNQSAEIDESLSKAGLSEVVGSIMSTIKDILAEAEPLWLSSKQMVEGPRPSPDRKAPLVQWDKGRFEDLVRDLTASIDTLYDLSRTRSSGAIPRRPSKAPYKGQSSTDEFRPFESTRMQTPQQIDPKTLTHLRARQGEGRSSTREVVFMSKTAYSELTHGTTRQPWAPLLLEYATFDSIYTVTGIMPPMSRFEKVSASLQQDPQRAPGTWTGLPRLLGYFEDIENSRLGLVYRFPPSFNAVSFEKLTQNPMYNLPSLGDLLARSDSEPPLEAKFRLAHNLTNTIFDMHTRGLTHGNLVDRNISFSDVVSGAPNVASGEIDVRRPLVSSFDLFPDEAPGSRTILSRHPLDPRIKPTSPLASSTDDRIFELYSLATLLLSVGLWTNLENLLPDASLTKIPESALDQLAIRCGTLYMKAVQACWAAVDDELAGKTRGEALISAVQVRTTRFLEACCILDGVSGLEQRLSTELHQADTASHQPPPKVEHFRDTKDIKSPSIAPGEFRQPTVPTPLPASMDIDRGDATDVENEGMFPVAPSWSLSSEMLTGSAEPLVKSASKSETKIRLYPHVPLSPEVVDKWNTILMPQINHALRHFYRKHPESVEISLESVGPSPQKTQPTVLVVCSSVGKVRAILKKRLGDLFEGNTGFALKVCRGHVLRSRRQTKAVTRSMARAKPSEHDGQSQAGDGEIEAVNPEFQERPVNGASIGAWIGDRHLPPVSFGGLVMVDNKPYGMTVHHMLDDPDRDFGHEETMRSSAIPGREWAADAFAESSVPDDDFAYELSDTESEPYSETDITSEYDDESDEEYDEPGDIPGIEPGCGEGYIVTQPALDDVEDGFYPCAETEDEDHIDTYSLGEVYASSGIRRKQANGLVHEVDWALFEFADTRLPDNNTIPRAQDAISPQLLNRKNDPNAHLRPTAVASSSALPGLEVQCVARTSGLQTGQILPALTSVKIYGRTSPSHTYQIASAPSMSYDASSRSSAIPMGIPGDSGAWVVDRHEGRLCGHVLAWSQRKRVAYICPMDVLMLDIAQTLEATEVRLPGGEIVVNLGATSTSKQAERDPAQQLADELNNLSSDNESDISDNEAPPELVHALPGAISSPNTSHQSASASGSGSSSPLRLDRSGELPRLTARMNSMNIGGSRRIDVSG